MTIVVTGGSRGIGKAIVEKFAYEKCQVFFCSKTKTSIKANLSTKKTNHIFPFVCDASNQKEVKKFVAFVSKHTDKVDVLVNNVGIYLSGDVKNGNPTELEKLFHANLFSALYCTQGFLPLIRKAKRKHVVFMNSIAGIEPYTNGEFYSITKYALHGLSNNFRQSVKNENIKVTDIFPGPVYTDSWKNSGISKQHFIQPQDIANSIWTLCNSSEASETEQIVFRANQLN